VVSTGSELEILTGSVAELRRRMLLLARLLPAGYVRLLDADLEDLEAEAFGADLLEGLSDSVELVASDVEPALREVWARMQTE
jgi:hypothetical protein